tara:strand:+ start:873 stop:1583 length:711 start_codon:yes stop_codon:yes gene_type:complete
MSDNSENIVKKIIVLAIPGDNFSSKFLICWTNTLNTLWQTGKYEFIIASGVNDFLPYARMKTLGLNVMNGIFQKPFSGSNFDIWLTINNDILFSPEQIIELIESTEKHPVVSGLYKNEDLINFSAVKNLESSYFVKNGFYEHLTQESIDQWKNETQLKYMPVAYTGLGFFAMRSEVLNRMAYPYFNGDMIEIIEGEKIIRNYTSEDFNFCQNIKKLGYEIVVNTDIRVGHLKNLVI